MKSLTILSALLSVSALAVVLASGTGIGNIFVESSGTGNGAGEQEIESLRQQITLLQGRVTELEAQGTPSGGVALHMGETPQSTVAIEGLVARFDPHGVISAETQKIDKARTTLLDENASLRERVDSARDLKRRNLYDAETTATLRELWGEAESWDEKRQVMRAFSDGDITPNIRDEIITTVTSAPAGERSTERLYWESISALNHMLPDPKVEALFTQIIQTSQSDRLANRAARALGVEWDKAPEGE